MKDRASCSYCGAPLPWVVVPPAGSDQKELNPEEITRLLGTPKGLPGVPQGVTYPVSCGACGEMLPDTRPVQCPRCHVLIRDPYTGKLVFGEKESQRLGTQKKTLTIFIMLFLLVLFFLFLLSLAKFKGNYEKYRSRFPGGAPPAPAPQPERSGPPRPFLE